MTTNAIDIYELIKYLNFAVFVLFVCCYFYQFVYILVYFFKKDKPVGEPKKKHRFGVIISARNEQSVIGELLSSIQKQTYPSELVDVYVVADNCDDDTAKICRNMGATVFERFNRVMVGKGYALDLAFHEIDKQKGLRYYDGYMVFDADNVLEPDYIEEVNKVFDRGYRVVTSYRNSKNFGDNWISAGYGLWFLREAKFLNGARMKCNTSCAISGTGFTVSSEIIEENGGWKHHLLTEDIEFTTDCMIHGEKIGYAEKAVLYDEQPVTWKHSWKQRMRWAKGFYQVTVNYAGGLLKQIFKNKSFQCYDMFMTIAPASFLTLLTILMNSVVFFVGFLDGNTKLSLLGLQQLGLGLGSVYLSMFVFGLLTVVTEWKRIYCSTKKKIKYVFTFPVFMLTYAPIAIAALVKPVKWEPIPHTISKSVSQIK